MPRKKSCIQKKPRVRVVTWFNFDVKDGLEKVNSKSMTIPDMTLSLKDLLERYVRGDGVPTFQPIYNGEEELPDFHAMTVQERLDYAREVGYHIEEIRSRLQTDGIIPTPPPSSEDGEAVPPSTENAPKEDA